MRMRESKRVCEKSLRANTLCESLKIDIEVDTDVVQTAGSLWRNFGEKYFVIVKRSINVIYSSVVCFKLKLINAQLQSVYISTCKNRD